LKKVFLCVVGASLVASSSLFAMADEYAVGVTAGTMGAGVTATTNIIQNVNLRINATGFNFNRSDSSGTDIDFDAKLKLFGVGAVADYHPFGGAFRLSGGAYYNGNKLTLDGKPKAGGTYTLNGTTYTADQAGTVHAEVKYEKISPYIGIGWGNAVDKSGHWKFSTDLGAMYTGSPKVSLTASNAANVPGMAADIAAEESKLKNDTDKLKWWPVLAVSLSYRF
jgi:hypothetical protein